MTVVKASQSGPTITHLLFADDNLLFYKANRVKGLKLKEVLRHYVLISDQSINFDKSDLIFISKTSYDDRRDFLNIFEVPECNSVEHYLGLPTFIGRNKKKAFRYIKERIAQQTKTLFSKSLSRVNVYIKEIMIKAMGHAIPIYVTGMFHIPQKTCKDL